MSVHRKHEPQLSWSGLFLQ